MRSDTEKTSQPQGLDNRTSPALSLPALLLQFLRIGVIGFGGGMAVIALMERDLVRKKHVLDAEEFIHGVGSDRCSAPLR